MKKRYLLLLPLIATLKASAQVNDVSFNVAPFYGYNWFDNKSTVANGGTYGLSAGFGFGPIIELRGTYEHSINLKQRLNEYQQQILQYFPNYSFESQHINFYRIGGELKANLPVGVFSPYFVLGTGVQHIKTDENYATQYKSENLYGTGGVGFKVQLGKRATINIEGKGFIYNMNPATLLQAVGNSTDYTNWLNGQSSKRMYNWSVNAGLQFYLGGQDYSNLSKMDKAYLRKFSSGMSEVKFTLAPVGAYVNFDNKSGFRNTYMLGGMLGLDLSDYVALKGYYYQATENEKVSFNFDKLSMYGVDFVGKLNVPRGIVPYITIGGGYLNVQDGYKGREIISGSNLYYAVKSGYYAKGGVGLELPLFNFLDVFGGASLLYTVNNSTDVTNVSNTDQLFRHTMYSVGLKLKLGKKANTAEPTNEAFQQKFSHERISYQKEIDSLGQELNNAYNTNDADKAVLIMQRKKYLDSLQAHPDPMAPADGYIRLTPAELESIIDHVLERVEKDSSATLLNYNSTRMPEDSVTITGAQTVIRNNDPAPSLTVDNSSDDYQRRRLEQEVKILRAQLNIQNDSIASLKEQNRAIRMESANNRYEATVPATTSVTFLPEPVSTIRYEGLGMFVAPNFGESGTFNLGLRAYFGFNESPIKLMPEAFVSFGKKTGYGLSINGLYTFKDMYDKFDPYCGLGVGIYDLGPKFRFTPDFIVGTEYHVNDSGNAFADYTVRGLFKNNQIAVGYRFKF